MTAVYSDCPVCAQLQRCWGGDRVWQARKLLRPPPPEEDVDGFLCRCPKCAAIYAFARSRDGMHLDESLEQVSWLDALALVAPDEREVMLADRLGQMAEWRSQLTQGSDWQAHEAARNLADLACADADWDTVRHLLESPIPAATLAAEMLHRKSRWRTAPGSVMQALRTVDSRSARWILAASEFLRAGIPDLLSGDPARFLPRLEGLGQRVSWLNDIERAALVPLLTHADARLRAGVVDGLSWDADPPGPALTAALRALREPPEDVAASVRLILARLSSSHPTKP